MQPTLKNTWAGLPEGGYAAGPTEMTNATLIFEQVGQGSTLLSQRSSDEAKQVRNGARGRRQRNPEWLQGGDEEMPTLGP